MKKLLSFVLLSAVFSSNYGNPVKRLVSSMAQFMPLCTPTRLNPHSSFKLSTIPANRILKRKRPTRFVAEIVRCERYEFNNRTDAINITAQAYREGADEIRWYIEE